MLFKYFYKESILFMPGERAFFWFGHFPDISVAD